MNIFPIPALKDNYIWCIVLPNSSQCLIIDPGEAAPVLTTLQQKNLQLSAMLITHHHWDHTGGVTELYQYSDAPIYGGKNEKNIPHCQHPVKDRDIITFPQQNFKLEVLDIPGHTSGHVAYYGNGVIFTGDTLFTGGCGRVFEGTPAQMYVSLQKLCQLPDTTLIYCGHEYTEANLKFALAVEPNNSALLARIEDTKKLRQNSLPAVPAALKLEKATNPFLRTAEPTVIKAVENYLGNSLADPVAVFTALRTWKNNF